MLRGNAFTITCFLLTIATNMSHSSIDPTIWMCVDGEVDTAVRTRDGSTYMFMSYWFWKLNDRLDGVVGNASLISHEWQHLYNNIETAFYMSGNSTPMTGKTFFIQDNKWFQFTNQVFEESGNVENWTDIPSGDLLVISQPNNPIIGVYEKHVGIGLVGYYFDKPLAPEVRHIVANTIPFDLSETCAVVAYDDGSYLVFYDDTKVGRNCRIVDVNRGCENHRLNSDLFDCPEYTKQLFNKNWFIRWWYRSQLTFRQFAIIFLTLLLVLLFILSFLCIIVGIKIRQLLLLRSKSHTNHIKANNKPNITQ